MASNEVRSWPRGRDLGSVYREQYSVKRRPDSFLQLLWCSAESLCLYVWVLAQTIALVVGLAVLHFTTFSAIACYLVNGIVRGRRELMPHSDADGWPTKRRVHDD